MIRHLCLQLALLASLAWQTALADQKPGTRCPPEGSNLVNGFRTECDVATIEGLKGHSASQILYEIAMEANLPNDTFFRNDSHVTCLLQDSSFALSGFAIGLGPVSITIPPIKYQGALCLYVADVPQGGLKLGQIRNLTKELILKEGCGKCGWVTTNYLSKNVKQEGFVRIDWRTNANCIENCIDPAKDLPPAAATDSPGKKSGVGALF
ncbi:hypothetical protein B0T14DRAFT_497455 [Immersiella caudata]|uniref:Uncharacterized protein n=1 Tax=Immersiella caudata TaxID=314043 RepID=A0AA39WIQ9_9PEZI|nr:hypothetical protein B0T14DRAFT_497455 [Immersiella caudata]